MSRIKAADRPSIELEDDFLDPLVRFSAEIGISEKTATRRLKEQIRQIAGCKYVLRKAGRRALASPPERSRSRA